MSGSIIESAPLARTAANHAQRLTIGLAECPPGCLSVVDGGGNVAPVSLN